MEENNQIIVDVNMEQLIAQLKALQVEYKANADELARYKKQLDEGEISQEDYEKAVLKNAQSQKVLKQEMSGVERQMQSVIKQQRANEGSLVEMRQQLSLLTKQYDSLPASIRDTTNEGKALQKRIEKLSEHIKDLEGNTGRWQRNVGNYKSALKGMKDATEAAGLSSKGLDRIMKGLSENPWMTVVTVLVTILVKLRNRMKDNEQVTTSLGNAMSSLQPIFEWFNKIISKIASAFSDLLDWAIQKVIQSLGWLGRQLQKIGNLFGKDWGSGLISYSETMKQTAEVTTKTAEATDKITESTKDYTAALKEARKELGKLIDELPTLEKVKKTLKEQSDELKKNLTAGFKAYYDDVAKTKLMIDDIMGKIVKDYKPVYGNIKKVAIDLDALIGKAEKLDKEKYKLKGTINDGTTFMERMEAEDSPLRKFKLEFDKNAKDIESVSSSLQSSFGSLSSIYKQMAADESKSEAEREAAAKKAKTWSALQIAANSGTAIAKGVAAAMDTPFPANIAALATTLAAVLSAIAQAKALAAESHAGGGVIGGTFTGATRGNDDVLMTGRRSELVLNADQQKRLFDIAEGTRTPSIAAEFAAALRQMPAPKLVLQELNDFQSRVTSITESQILK